MTERDRAAVDVDLLPVEPELVAIGEHLRGERLVDLDQVEIVDRAADLLDEPANAVDGSLEQPLGGDVGLRVPDDLAIVGFDDIELAAYTSPPLTTVAQPKEAIGTGAAGLLLERLREGRTAQRRAILQPELHRRASTARPHDPMTTPVSTARAPA